MKSTATQQDILNRMKPGRWYSAYDLKANINSLWGLERKELVDRKEGLGSLAFPRTSILWRLKSKDDEAM